ncbi:MAG: hypothetical protein D6775_06335, partial [Caldilineae bacterium]
MQNRSETLPTHRPSAGQVTAWASSVILVLGLSCLALGIWGAWLPHRAAGLVILGIDLAEYVKFIPEVSSGQIPLSREVFFNPLLALMLTLWLMAVSRRLPLTLAVRAVLLCLAVPATLALLPPAWTPALLRTAEFRTQTLYILLLLAGIVLSPLFYRYLPARLPAVLLVLVGLLPFPALRAYLLLQPALAGLYGEPVQPGWGFYFT